MSVCFFQVQVQRIDNKTLTEEERSKMVSVKITQLVGEYWLSRRSISADNVTLQTYTIPESAIIDLRFPVLQSIQFIHVEVSRKINISYRT